VAIVVDVLERKASGDPEAAQEEQAEERLKHRFSSLFTVAPAAPGRNNVPILFSLVKRRPQPICKWLNKRRCSASARRIPQAELTYRCRPQGW
jgi:hypothetical protein